MLMVSDREKPLRFNWINSYRHSLCQTWGVGWSLPLSPFFVHCQPHVLRGRKKHVVLIALEKLSCPDLSSPDLLLSC